MAQLIRKGSRQDAEAILERRFKGKICELSLPGKKKIYGMVESLTIDMITPQNIIIVIDRRRSVVSIECLNESLKALNDGYTPRTE